MRHGDFVLAKNICDTSMLVKQMLGDTSIAFFCPIFRVTKLPVNIAIFSYCYSKVEAIRKTLTCKYLENICRGMFLLLMLEVNSTQLQF